MLHCWLSSIIITASTKFCTCCSTTSVLGLPFSVVFFPVVVATGIVSATQHCANDVPAPLHRRGLLVFPCKLSFPRQSVFLRHHRLRELQCLLFLLLGHSGKALQAGNEAFCLITTGRLERLSRKVPNQEQPVLLGHVATLVYS